MQQRNKIYFKGNAITNNNYVPKSGQQNRVRKQFLVEMPEGQAYFPPTRKKQFMINQHHQSQIKEQGLFNKGEKVKKHSNLDIEDIEGTFPITLTQKAQLHKHRKHYLIHKIKTDASLPGNTRLQTISYQTDHPYQHTSSASKTPALNYHLDTRNHLTEQEPYSSQVELPHYKIQEKSAQQIEVQGERNYPPSLSPIESRNKEQQEPMKMQQKHPDFALGSLKKRDKPPVVSIEGKGLQKDKGIRNLKGKKDLQSMWHGDGHKITLLPLQEIRKWNPTFLPEYPYFPKINPQ